LGSESEQRETGGDNSPMTEKTKTKLTDENDTTAKKQLPEVFARGPKGRCGELPEIIPRMRLLLRAGV
jgi:hypothetical protein